MGEKKFLEEWNEFLHVPGNPFDLASFGYGILAGGIITVVVEGVTLYFTWPVWVAFLRALVGGEVIREFLR